MDEEGLEKTKNKLIFIGKQIDIDTSKFINELWKLKGAAAENNDEVAIRALHEIVPTFTTPEEFNKTVLMQSSQKDSNKDESSSVKEQTEFNNQTISKEGKQ